MSPWLFLNETGCYAIHGGPSFVLSMALGTLSASSTVAPALGTSRTVPATLVQFLLFHRVLPLKGQQTSVAMPFMAQPTLAASGGRRTPV